MSNLFAPSEIDELLVPGHGEGSFAPHLEAKLREAGLIARAGDRGDSVLQSAPPLISDAALLDEIVDRLGEVLVEAGVHMGGRVAA